MRHRCATGLILISLCIFGSLQAQVTLPSGVTVPKDHFIVYLFGGSCNMSGRTPDVDKVPDPRCWAWGTGANAKDVQAWVPCVDLIFNDAAGAGPATPFLKTMASRYPGYYFGVVQMSNSIATIREMGATDGFLGKGYVWYDKLVADAKKLKASVTLAGYFTMIGIVEAQDASNGTTQYTASISDDWKKMVDSMRSDLGLTPQQLPAIQQEQEHEGLGNLVITLPGPAQVWAQDLLIPSKVSNSATVSSKGIPIAFDTHHYDHAGETEVTKRLADTIKAKHLDFWYSNSGINISAAPSGRTARDAVTLHTGSRILLLSIPAGANVNVSIARIDGTVVRRACLDGNAAVRRIDGLAPGIYVVDMMTKNLHTRDRVIIR
jgi:hypothetical protein